MATTALRHKAAGSVDAKQSLNVRVSSSTLDCLAEYSYKISTEDLPSLFGAETCPQHSVDEAAIAGIVLDHTRSRLLVGADTDMFHSNDVHYFFDAFNVSLEAREEVPQADHTSGISDHACMI